MIKLVYIISGINKSVVFERTAIELSKSYDLTFILLNNADSDFEKYLRANHIRTVRMKERSKPTSIFAFISLCKYLRELKPDIVHCHLLYASLLGFAAAKWVGIKKRIYTRHHSNFHFDYAPHAIKYDRWINKNAYKIVAVSTLVKNFLVEMEGVNPDKIFVVEHGIIINDYQSMEQQRIEAIRSKYGLQNHVVVGSVARYDRWKGVQYTIAAFVELLKTNPQLKLVLANAGKGDNVDEINRLLEKLPQSAYVQIPFEIDIIALFKCMDVYIHVPIDNESEAFGQVYIEAMAAGVPLVVTKSGIANEILEHLENAYIVNYMNADDIVKGVQMVLDNPELKDKMVKKALETVVNKFFIQDKIEQLKSIYNQA